MEVWKKMYGVITDLAHVLFGVLTVFAAVYVHPVVSTIMFLVFVIYELDEEWHLEDESYEDIREYGIGLGIGVVATIIQIFLTRLSSVAVVDSLVHVV